MLSVGVISGILNPQEKDPDRSKKSDRSLINKLDYYDVEFPVKINELSIKLRNRIVSKLMFLVMKINKHIQFMFHKE